MSQKFSRRTIAKTIAQKLVAEPGRSQHWLKVLAAYILENRLVASADLVINDTLREISALTGEMLVDVTTARPLSSAMRTDMTAMLREALAAKHVVLTENVDPDLLGGFVAQANSATLDASVRTRLNQVASL